MTVFGFGIRIKGRGVVQFFNTATDKARKFEFRVGGVQSALNKINFKGLLAGVLAWISITNAANMAHNAIKSVLQETASFETARVQVKQFVGTFRLAAIEINKLKVLAAKTPFNLTDMVQADKQLLAFGFTMVDTKENLLAVGDAAAATGQPLQNLAFWFGRAYAAIQGGMPIGEVQMRMAEFGLAIPGMTDRITQLRKEGAKTEEIWKLWRTQFDKTKGAMQDLSKTYEGRVSTMQDAWEGFLRAVGDAGPLELAKNIVIKLTEAIESWSKEGGLGATIGRMLVDVFFDLSTHVGTAILKVERFLQRFESVWTVLKHINEELGRMSLQERGAELGKNTRNAILNAIQHGGSRPDARTMRKHYEEALAASEQMDEVRRKLSAMNTAFHAEAREAWLHTTTLSSANAKAQNEIVRIQAIMANNLPMSISDTANYDRALKVYKSFLANYVGNLRASNKDIEKALRERAKVEFDASRKRGAKQDDQTKDVDKAGESLSKLGEYVKAFQSLMAEMRKEVNTALREQIDNVGELTDADKKRMEQERESAREELARFKRKMELEKQRKKSQAAASAILKSLRTDEEKLADTIKVLSRAWAMGALDIRQYTKAVNKLQAQFDKGLRKTLRSSSHIIALGQNVGSIFTDSLRAMASETVSTSEAFREFWQNMLTMFTEYMFQEFVIKEAMALLEEKLSKRKAASNATESVSNTTKATSGFFSAYASIPWVGVALALASIAVMFAFMKKSKKESQAATAFADGGFADSATFGVFGEAGPEWLIPDKNFQEHLNSAMIDRVSATQLVAQLKDGPGAKPPTVINQEFKSPVFKNDSQWARQIARTQRQLNLQGAR